MNELEEEARQLLRRIVERLAWRQIFTIDVLGHCLKFVTELDRKLRVAAELDLELRLFHEVRSLYRELGWEDLESAVRHNQGRISYPGSRAEFGAAYMLTGLAERVAMEAYTGSRSKQFAAIALSYVEAARHRPEPTIFLEFAADPSNRPLAQQFLSRWAEIGLRSFGRPGTTGDDRALTLGLRTKSVAQMIREFLAGLEPFLLQSGLVLPDFAALGLELPAASARPRG